MTEVELLEVVANYIGYLTLTNLVLGLCNLFALGWIAGHQR